VLKRRGPNQKRSRETGNVIYVPVFVLCCSTVSKFTKFCKLYGTNEKSSSYESDNRKKGARTENRTSAVKRTRSPDFICLDMHCMYFVYYMYFVLYCYISVFFPSLLLFSV
jgi:hypothetical protein